MTNSSPEDTEFTSTNPTATAGWSPSLALTCVVAVASGLIGLMVFKSIDPVFAFETMKELPIQPSDEQLRQFTSSFTDFHSRNAAINLGIIGACLGLGIGGVAVQRSRVASSIAAAIVAGIGGMLAGYLTGIVVGKAMATGADQSLIQSVLLHFAVWACMVAGLAATVGWLQAGTSQAVSGAIAGLLAGVVASVGYIIAASIAFPSANLIHTVPETISQRYVWIVTCCLLLAIALSFGLKPARNAAMTHARDN